MDVNQIADPLAIPVLSALSVWLIQRLKAWSAIPWINENSKVASRIVSGFSALLAAAGITVSFNHDLGVLTITGLTLTTIGVGLWKWLESFVVNELLYQTAVNKAAPGTPITTTGPVKEPIAEIGTKPAE